MKALLHNTFGYTADSLNWIIIAFSTSFSSERGVQREGCAKVYPHYKKD